MKLAILSACPVLPFTAHPRESGDLVKKDAVYLHKIPDRRYAPSGMSGGGATVYEIPNMVKKNL